MTTTASDTGTPVTASNPAAAGTDLLGRPLADHERVVLEVYTGLTAALRRDDLPPCAAANLRAALAPVAVAVTDLGLHFDHLIDLGV